MKYNQLSFLKKVMLVNAAFTCLSSDRSDLGLLLRYFADHFRYCTLKKQLSLSVERHDKFCFLENVQYIKLIMTSFRKVYTHTASYINNSVIKNNQSYEKLVLNIHQPSAQTKRSS